MSLFENFKYPEEYTKEEAENYTGLKLEYLVDMYKVTKDIRPNASRAQ